MWVLNLLYLFYNIKCICCISPKNKTRRSEVKESTVQWTRGRGGKQHSCWFMQLLPSSQVAKSLQLCLTPCDPMDCSLPGPSVHRIFQARILEWWVAISYSMGSSQPRDQTGVCCISYTGRQILYQLHHLRSKQRIYTLSLIAIIRLLWRTTLPMHSSNSSMWEWCFLNILEKAAVYSIFSNDKKSITFVLLLNFFDSL